MEEVKKTVGVKELAEELDMTVSNINIQIGKGHAGEVIKVGDGQTKDYNLSIDNVIQLLNWLRANGRGDKRKLMQTYTKYKDEQ